MSLVTAPHRTITDRHQWPSDSFGSAIKLRNVARDHAYALLFYNFTCMEFAKLICRWMATKIVEILSHYQERFPGTGVVVKG